MRYPASVMEIQCPARHMPDKGLVITITGPVKATYRFEFGTSFRLRAHDKRKVNLAEWFECMTV